MPDWLKALWWDCCWWSCSAGMIFGGSLRVRGTRHMPQTGPALLIANHQSFFDPVLIGIAARRRLSYLARKTLFDNRFFAFLIDTLNAVPIDQDGVGKEGIKTILAQLQQGRAVVVFPEGERTEDGKMLPLKPGISLLIKRVNAPLIPIGIAGAHAAWPRHQLLPLPAPLFMPPWAGTMAVSVGPALDGKRFADLPRDQLLKDLFGELQKVQLDAERLRRK